MALLRAELSRVAVALCRAQVRRSCPLGQQLVFSLVGVLCWLRLAADVGEMPEMVCGASCSLCSVGCVSLRLTFGRKPRSVSRVQKVMEQRPKKTMGRARSYACGLRRRADCAEALPARCSLVEIGYD